MIFSAENECRSPSPISTNWKTRLIKFPSKTSDDKLSIVYHMRRCRFTSFFANLNVNQFPSSFLLCSVCQFPFFLSLVFVYICSAETFAHRGWKITSFAVQIPRNTKIGEISKKSCVLGTSRCMRTLSGIQRLRSGK